MVVERSVVKGGVVVEERSAVRGRGGGEVSCKRSVVVVERSVVRGRGGGGKG